MDGERCDAYLSLDFLPGPLRVSGVLDVKQCIIDAGERLSGVFIMAAGSENHMPENRDGKSCDRMDDRFKLDMVTTLQVACSANDMMYDCEVFCLSNSF